MLEHTKKPHTEHKNAIIDLHHGSTVYRIPEKIAEKYRISERTISADTVFSALDKKYTKPGALLQGIRAREDLTQVEMATILGVTQSDISQMENGVRKIGRIIAKRIEKEFNVDYKSFLE
jgi:DNA-binding XRE family transcriptional regulator